MGAVGSLQRNFVPFFGPFSAFLRSVSVDFGGNLGKLTVVGWQCVTYAGGVVWCGVVVWYAAAVGVGGRPPCAAGSFLELDERCGEWSAALQPVRTNLAVSLCVSVFLYACVCVCVPMSGCVPAERSGSPTCCRPDPVQARAQSLW